MVPRTALPPGMGFYAKIRDTEGNVVGLHAGSPSRCVVPTDRPVRTGRRLTLRGSSPLGSKCPSARIYRDIQDLSLSGVPIEREAGSGYRMGREFEVRPIMFTFDEVRRWWRAADGRKLGRSSSRRRLCGAR